MGKGISDISGRPLIFSEVVNEWLPWPVEVLLPVHSVGIQFYLRCLPEKLVNVTRLGGGFCPCVRFDGNGWICALPQPTCCNAQARCVGDVSPLLSQWAASWSNADLATLATHAVCTHSLQFWVILNLFWQFFLVLLILENECNIFLQNTRNYSPNVTASHPRRLESSGTVIIITFRQMILVVVMEYHVFYETNS